MCPNETFRSRKKEKERLEMQYEQALKGKIKMCMPTLNSHSLHTYLLFRSRLVFKSIHYHTADGHFCKCFDCFAQRSLSPLVCTIVAGPVQWSVALVVC